MTKNWKTRDRCAVAAKRSGVVICHETYHESHDVSFNSIVVFGTNHQHNLAVGSRNRS